MTNSPLRLERYFFSKVHLEAHAKVNLKADNVIHCSVEIGQAVDDSARFQVTLKLKLESAPEAQSCYTGEFDAVGFFGVEDEWPKDRVVQLIETNGPALLYGALRELVFTLTARGPWPAVTLDTVSFFKDGGNKSRSASTKPSATAKKPRVAKSGSHG